MGLRMFRVEAQVWGFGNPEAYILGAVWAGIELGREFIPCLKWVLCQRIPMLGIGYSVGVSSR